MKHLSKWQVTSMAAAAVVIVVALLFLWSAAGAWRVDSAVRQLKRSDPSTHEAAIARLASLRGQRDLRRLVWHLGDDDPAVRERVARALVAIGDPAIEAAADEAQSQLTLPTDRWDTIVRGLHAQDWFRDRSDEDRRARLRDALMELFPRFGRRAAPTIMAMFCRTGPRDAVIRTIAAGSLGQLGDAKCFETALTAVHDPEEGVRIFAVWGLGKSADARAIEPLLGAMDAGRGLVMNIFAANALAGFSSDPRVAAMLIKWLSATWCFGPTRAAAAKSLGFSTDPRALDALIARIGDSNSQVRDSVVDALVRLPDSRKQGALVAALRSGDEAMCTGTRRALARIESSGAQVESTEAAE